MGPVRGSTLLAIDRLWVIRSWLRSSSPVRGRIGQKRTEIGTNTNSRPPATRKEIWAVHRVAMVPHRGEPSAWPAITMSR